MTIEVGLDLTETAVNAAFRRVDLVPDQPERSRHDRGGDAQLPIPN